jgi:hypothetical protein
LDFQSLKEKFEDDIRLGEIVTVKNEIETIKTTEIPRQLMASFADIARRVRSENWGLRLLRPIVRSETEIHPPVTDDERCAYAGLLIKVGALPEAEELLGNLDESKTANVLNFYSQIHIAQWNYRKAITYLKKIGVSTTTTDYQKCIAEVNLAGAYIFLQEFEKAKKLLPKILSECQIHSWDLLYGNALEISAQLSVMQKEWIKASEFLNLAVNSAGQHSHYNLFIEKWRRLSELFQTKPNSSEAEAVLTKIDTLRNHAQKLFSWESVRDLDYYVGVHLNQQNLLLNVYFGTPFSDYKKRIENLFKEKGWKIPNDYYRKLSSEPASRILDIETGLEEDREMVEIIKPGQMLHRFLNILATDFYKPIGVGQLFSKLFPDEYFNPETSADRIAQAVKQIRKWFLINEIPLDVNVESNLYNLSAYGPYALKLSKSLQNSDELLDAGFELQLKKLIEKWPYQSFSTSKAADELQISSSSVRTILEKALDQKRIFKSGAGRSVLYRFQK